MIVATTAVVAAEPAKKTFDLDLPADSAEKSLKRFGEQSGMEVLFPTSAVKGVRTRAVKGEMTARAALDAILGGTPLVAVADDKTSSVTIKLKPEGPNDPNASRAAQATAGGRSPDSQKKSETLKPQNQQPIMKRNRLLTRLTAMLALFAGFPASAQQKLPVPATAAPEKPVPGETVVLSPFEVSTARDTGYVSTAAGSAGRVSQDLRDIPQSISVINQELIRDLSPNSLDDILRYTSSVDAPGDDRELYTMRGANASVPLTNGFRTPRQFPGDTYDIERVEVMDGPSASTFGDVSGNGGIINKVTKKPRFTRATNVLINYTDATEQVVGQVDFNTVLGRGKKAAMRVILVGSDSGRWREKDHSYRRTLQVLPKFLYRFGGRTELVVESSFLKGFQSLGQQLGLNYDYVLYRNPNTGAYNTSASTTTGSGASAVTVANVPTLINIPDAANPEANLVQGKLFSARVNFALSTQLNDNWAMQLTGLASDVRTKWFRPSVAKSLSNTTSLSTITIKRGRPDERDRRVGNNFIDVDVLGRYQFNWGKLHVAANGEYGYDHVPDHVRQQAATTVLPAFNFLNPDYSVRIDDATLIEKSMKVSNSFNKSGTLRGFASLLNDRLLLNGSERWMKQKQTGRSTGRPKTFAHSPVYKTPFYGVTVRPIKDVSIYYSHTEGIRLSTTAQADGILLPPTINQQDEYGVKTSLFGDKLLFSTNYFENARVNLKETDPVTGEQFVVGEETAKGYDLRLQGIVGGFQVIGNYTHTVKQRTASIDPIKIGEVYTGFAKHRASGLVTYTVPSGALKYVRLGVGTVYQSKRMLRFPSATKYEVAIPQSIRFNAFVSYRPRGKRYEMQVNVDNIEDRLWYPSGNTTRWIVGAPRTIKVQAGYNF